MNGARYGLLRQEDPPPRTGRSYTRPWARIAKDLREKHPGEWWVVMEDGGLTTSSMTQAIRTGASHWRPRGAYLAEARTVNGIVTLYAKYVGGPRAYDRQK